jgi:hypothetical protein
VIGCRTMSALSVEAQLTASLRAMNTAGGYPMSLVCTDRGLLIASAGEFVRSEVIAGITSLFDDIALRAARDLGLADIDELSPVRRPRLVTLVVRPVTRDHTPRLFLVVQVPRHRAWRQNTNVAVRSLLTILGPLLTNIHPSK